MSVGKGVKIGIGIGCGGCLVAVLAVAGLFALGSAANSRAEAKQAEVIAQALKENRVVIGMTSDQIIQSWGKPEKINRTVNGRNIHEQWIYGKNYLYLDNGVMTSFQE